MKMKDNRQKNLPFSPLREGLRMGTYLKFLSRNKLYTFINIAGLSISLMFVILLGDYTWRQLSMDSWHKNADRIYLIGSQHGFFMWPETAVDIKAMCPEVEQLCRLISQSGRIRCGQQEVRSNGQDEPIILLSDSTFFQFFDFPLLEGDRRSALNAPDKCVITDRLARRLFGDKSPIGQSLLLLGDRHVSIGLEDPYDSTLVYTISGVVGDFDHTVLPNETEVIASMQRYPQVMGYELSANSFAYGPTGAAKAFYMLYEGASLEGRKGAVNDYLKKVHSFVWEKDELTLTPLTDLLFAPQNDGYSGMQKSDKTRLHILLTAVLAILFFAVSNYINLTVANTGFRAKEMATRRLFGSSRGDISLKLIAESTMMVAICFAIGLALALCVEAEAAELFKGKIALKSDLTPATVSLCLGFILAIGIVSGILPSWQMSRFQPIDIVKGSFRFHSKMVLGRLFIMVQNVITITMLTSSFVIWLQLNHLIHAPLGFNTENLYYVYAPQENSQAVRSQLEKMPFVERIGTFQNTSFTGYSCSLRTLIRDGRYVKVFLSDLDQAAFDLYGLKIIKDYGATNGGYYLTEEAVRQLNLSEDDRELDWGNGEKIPIAGVLADIHRINVLNGVEPFAIRLQATADSSVSFLVKTNGYGQAKPAFLAMLRELEVPEMELEWAVNSLEDNIADTFADQQNTLRIVSLFALIAIVISVMGYVGMSLFFIRQRKKEIAIRKVMGATSGEVLALMLRTFSAPLLVSFVIAVPVSWHIMTDWLSNFSYRIALSPWIFAAAGATSFIVSLLTIIVQSWHAASENPINNIKTE